MAGPDNFSSCHLMSDGIQLISADATVILFRFDPLNRMGEACIFISLCLVHKSVTAKARLFLFIVCQNLN